MNVYLEHGGLLRNHRHIRQLSRRLPPKEPIELSIRSEGRVSLLGLIFLAVMNPRLRNMELTINIKKVRSHMILFANSSPSFSLRFTAAAPLTAREWKRASRLSTTIYVEDSTEGLNRHFYESNRRVIWSDRTFDGIGTSEAYATAVKMPLKNCRFSSCLGKTVYISATGKASFCPFHPEETAMGQIGQLEKLFYTEAFAGCLTGMIRKRAACKNSCPRFAQCKGGCPFDHDCSDYLKRCDLAQRDIQELLNQRCDLSAVPLYKEQAIIYQLFSRKK